MILYGSGVVTWQKEERNDAQRAMTEEDCSTGNTICVLRMCLEFMTIGIHSNFVRRIMKKQACIL